VTSAKLGPEAKLLIQSRQAGAEERVDVLLRLREEPTPETRRRLEESGVQLRTIAGDIVTASLASDSLEQVADLEDVLHLELSTPLFREEQPVPAEGDESAPPDAR
jgi:hypothetical protein